MALLCLFFSQKGHRLFSLLETTRIYKGKTMSNDLEISSKKLHIIRTAIGLFTTYGFHTAGVDLIAKQCEVPKATLYNYFRSKEGLIEMCIAFQKSLLKEEVLAIIYSSHYRAPTDKLKEIVVLHVNYSSLYHLLLKAFFEIKVTYPQAYRMAIEYRKWLNRELFDLVFSLETRDLRPSADMVLNLIDGLMFEFLSTDSVENRDMAMDCFFKPICLK